MTTTKDKTGAASGLSAAAGYARKLEQAKEALRSRRWDLLKIESEMTKVRSEITSLEVDVKTYELLAKKESNASMTREEYAKLKSSGMMWEMHPEFTGSYEADILSHTCN